MTLEEIAQQMHAEWLTDQGAPVPEWSEVQSAVRRRWIGIARIGQDAPPDTREQWTIAVVDGTTARSKPHIVLTSTNGEVVLTGEVRSNRSGAAKTVESIIAAGLRGFVREQ